MLQTHSGGRRDEYGKEQTGIGDYYDFDRCCILGIVRKLWPVFVSIERSDIGLASTDPTDRSRGIDPASVIHQRQRKCICHVERSAGAAGHSDLCTHWHDALSIRIFHNDPVFQRRNSHGAAVHRTGHDPCVSVYSEPQKTENI